MKRAVLVLVAVALAVAVGLFLVPDGEERASVESDARGADERTEIGAVELASDDEVSDARIDVSSADQRPVARADADALHWRDLLLAVDHPTGVELDASEVEVRLVTGEGELIVRALDDAVRASDRFQALVPTPRRIAAGSPPWTSTLETTLANGDWTATIAAAPRVDEDTTGRSFTDEERCGWVGTATFEVVTGAPTEVAIELGRAAVVRGSVRAFNGEDSDWGTFVDLLPTDEAGWGGAELWSAWGESLDAEVAIHTLLPNTEYRVEGSGRTFTTGGPGSVTVLEEQSPETRAGISNGRV